MTTHKILLTKMKIRLLLVLSYLWSSCAASPQLNYIKTEVYKSSWNPGQVLKKIWLGKDCSRLCQMTYNCTAYHHDRCFRICELGNKNEVKSASQPGTDTVTVFIQPENWKLLLTNNAPPVDQSVEVINFKSNSSVCTPPPDYPIFVRGSFGGLIDKVTPMVCGGIEPTSDKCYKLESGVWQTAPSLLEPNGHFTGMPFSPFHNLSHKFFILGGYSENLNAKVLTDSGWESTRTVAPVQMSAACMAPIDDDNYFVHGGIQKSTAFSPQTYIFTASKNLWTRGPDLPIGRFGEGCGSLPMNEKSNQMSIIVAGGFADGIGAVSSVDILDIGSRTWRSGTALPQPSGAAPMVQHPNGGVIYIMINSFYYLANAGAAARWQLLPQKVTKPRQWFLAFFVPDDVVPCT